MLPSREELMVMPLILLEKSLRPESPAEEAQIQEVLDLRRQNLHVQQNIYRNDAIAANIQTPEQEAEWQKKIDDRLAKVKPAVASSEAPAEAFCKFCDSKGVRHKLNCTRSKDV